MSDMQKRLESIGAVYLARGADDNALAKFKLFRQSYRRWPAGAEHRLHVIFKGFENGADLAVAREVFRDIACSAIYLEDDAFDLGAYFAAASRLDCKDVIFLNTASEICGHDWLLKLAVNLAQRDVGMVSCTASFEAPQHPGQRNLPFPNPHLRTTAFMLQRERFLAMRPNGPLTDKLAGYMLEHGMNNFTRQIASQGLKALLVGKNGRAYDRIWWPQSRTFRQGTQSNLLVADNQTKAYDRATQVQKRFLHELCWGHAGIRYPIYRPAAGAARS